MSLRIIAHIEVSLSSKHASKIRITFSNTFNSWTDKKINKFTKERDVSFF